MPPPGPNVRGGPGAAGGRSAGLPPIVAPRERGPAEVAAERIWPKAEADPGRCSLPLRAWLVSGSGRRAALWRRFAARLPERATTFWSGAEAFHPGGTLQA